MFASMNNHVEIVRLIGMCDDIDLFVKDSVSAGPVVMFRALMNVLDVNFVVMLLLTANAFSTMF